MVEGFKILLSRYDQEYLINPSSNLIKLLRAGERRNHHDRRLGNFETRMRWDCWDAYNKATQNDKQDQLKLQIDDELEIINALSDGLKNYKFMEIGHQPLDCKRDVVGVVTHEVVEKMRQQQFYTAINTIHGVADEIYNQFHIEFFARRNSDFERRISISDSSNVDTPITNKRSSSRQPCDFRLEISNSSNGATGEFTVDVIDLSLEGIGFISSKKLKIREIVRMIKTGSKKIPSSLAKQYFIMREQKTKQGFFYGAQAVAA